MTEDELIEGLKKQNRAAYEYAYLTYNDLVCKAIFKYVPVMEDAEELLQDVFVKAFRKIDQFNGHSQLSTWLTKIAINASLNFIKSKTTQKEVILQATATHDQDEEKDQDTLSDLSTPEELVLLEEERLILHQAFSKLTIDQFTACRLFYLEEVPQLEIAQIMGMSLDAVQSLIHRGENKTQNNFKNAQSNLTSCYRKKNQECLRWKTSFRRCKIILYTIIC